MELFITSLLMLTVVSRVFLTDGSRSCSREQFPCADSGCVSLSLRCDGVEQCGDGSDEVSCSNCTADSFHCVATARCISAQRVCDGQADCSDGADEWPDACVHQTCSRSEFRCSSGHCVPNSWRCDHSNDCEDGSDEEKCEQNECESGLSGCSHICIDLRFGFMCDCPGGMRLVQDTHCEETDPCLDWDVCDQQCVPSNGSLVCGCQDGFLLTAGTGQCQSTGSPAHLLLSTYEGLKLMDLGGSVQRNITAQKHPPGPITSLSSQNVLYWTNPESDVIYNVSLDLGFHKPAEFLKASRGIVGLTVDWIHDVLYWVSTSTRSVHVSSLSGAFPKQLVSGLSRPTAIAVQPLAGYIFWADCGPAPKIERASLEGANRMTLIESSLRYPEVITLDLPRGLLYWADTGLRSISRVTFSGKHRKTVVESNGYLDRPFGLAVFESRVYWTDLRTNSTCSADKHSGRQLRVSHTLHPVSPAGLVILHPSLQPPAPSPAPSESSKALPDSPIIWFLCLSVIFGGLFLLGSWRWRSVFRGRPSSLSGSVPLKESQDPLLLS